MGLRDLLSKHLNFVKIAFSDNGVPSSSRLLSIPHFVVAGFSILWTTIKTGGHPDYLAITALSGFAVAPYAVNRASNMFSYQKKDIDTSSTSSISNTKDG
jgi:hypothetical protein